MTLRAWAQLFLSVMSVGMSWLVRQGATLDPPSADHPQAVYLGLGLEMRATLWLSAGVVGIMCVAIGTRRALDFGYMILTIWPIQRSVAWLWESATAVWQHRWYDAMSTLFIAVFWAALVGVVLAAASIPGNVGLRRT